MEILSLLCYFGALIAFGNLLADTDHLDLRTRRYRIMAIWGIIFALVWLGNTLTT
jgi:hypothetical protein